MKKILLILALAAVVMQVHGAAKAPEKQDLRVLYVGGTPEVDNFLGGLPADQLAESVAARMQAFERFLNDYFTHVTVVNAKDYTQQMSDDYDVTVLDGIPNPITPRITDREKGIYLQAGYFTEDFDRPVLTIAEVGDRTGRRIGIKNDWYCLCLDADAHSWRPEHPIFHGPFDVTMTVVDKPTPEDAYHYPYYYDGPLPDKLPMWRVQTAGFADTPGFRIGMVARPWGYEDSPDAEYISSGVCQKTLDAVAIGRHGNFFHWGFAASPDYMTEEAKPVLANAIVYISQFAGQKPIARKYNDRMATREYLKELRYLLTREYYEERLKSDAEWAEQMAQEQKAAKEKQARGEKLTPQETQMLGFTPSNEQKSFEEHLQRYGKAFYDMFGTDIPAYGRFFDENYDYFYGGEGTYELVVDEDVKSLGIPNYDQRLIDAAIGLLERGVDTDRMRRILARYTLVDFPTAEGWREWYEANKERLFFTESGGWLFLVDSREPGVNDYHAREARQSVQQLAPGKTDDNNPVAVAMEVVPQQDGSRMVYVKARIHPGYHIYGNVAASDAFEPTVLKVELPEGYTTEGEWTYPVGKPYNQKGTTLYEDEVVFSQKISGSGSGQLKCTVSYQCCDAHICFPPETVERVFTL